MSELWKLPEREEFFRIVTLCGRCLRVLTCNLHAPPGTAKRILMTLRTLRIITVTFVSHLLLAPLAFTTQLPTLASTAESPQPSQEVTIKARQQEKQGDIYKLDGDVEIAFQNYILRASRATYNAATGAVEATGGVVFDGGPHDAHLTAARATYNVKSETGTYYEVAGTFGAVLRGQTVVLTTGNPFVIAGREVRKVGPSRYIVLHGSITSCAEPVPTWTFNAEKIDLVAGDDAKLYHSSFRLLKLPIFSFPMARRRPAPRPAPADSCSPR